MRFSPTTTGTFLGSATITSNADSASVSLSETSTSSATLSPTITSVTPFCDGPTSRASIIFSGTPGDFGGFYIDIDRDGDWGNGFFKRFVPASATGTYRVSDAPAGFQPYGGEGDTLTFTPSNTYHVRVYNGQHSSVQTFTALDCEGGQIAAPTVSPFCSDAQSQATISWDEGNSSLGYWVDISLDSGFSSFWNKFVPSGTTTTMAPDGFEPYVGVSGNLVLSGGNTY